MRKHWLKDVLVDWLFCCQCSCFVHVNKQNYVIAYGLVMIVFLSRIPKEHFERVKFSKLWNLLQNDIFEWSGLWRTYAVTEWQAQGAVQHDYNGHLNSVSLRRRSTPHCLIPNVLTGIVKELALSGHLWEIMPLHRLLLCIFAGWAISMKKYSLFLAGESSFWWALGNGQIMSIKDDKLKHTAEKLQHRLETVQTVGGCPITFQISGWQNCIWYAFCNGIMHEMGRKYHDMPIAASVYPCFKDETPAVDNRTLILLLFLLSASHLWPNHVMLPFVISIRMLKALLWVLLNPLWHLDSLTSTWPPCRCSSRPFGSGM